MNDAQLFFFKLLVLKRGSEKSDNPKALWSAENQANWSH